MPENWAPSKYELICVYTERPAPNSDVIDTKLLDDLRYHCERANVRLRPVNVDRAMDRRQETHRRRGRPALPYLILRYPDSTDQIPPVWTGQFEMDDVRRVFESPARTQLAARLKQGHASAVILLLSGDEARDASARAFLAEHLPRLAGRIELPKKSDEGPQVTWDAPVRVEFPVIEVSRTPAEDVFVQMLLGSEDGLKDVKGPIAFPVFGRGRALCSLQPGPGHRATQRSLILCNACSYLAKNRTRARPLVSTDKPLCPKSSASGRTAIATGHHCGGNSGRRSRRPSIRLPSARRSGRRLSGIWVLRSRRRPGWLVCSSATPVIAFTVPRWASSWPVQRPNDARRDHVRTRAAPAAHCSRQPPWDLATQPRPVPRRPGPDRAPVQRVRKPPLQPQADRARGSVHSRRR